MRIGYTSKYFALLETSLARTGNCFVFNGDNRAIILVLAIKQRVVTLFFVLPHALLYYNMTIGFGFPPAEPYVL